MSSEWQFGNPPVRGWYLVTAKSPASGSYVIQAFYNPEYSICWQWGNEFVGVYGWPSPGVGMGKKPLPVLAWMPLPEPFSTERAEP